MKFFVAFTALVAVSVASPLVKPVNSDLDVLGAIVAAIHSPSTDPATAALLEQQLQDILATTNPEPIAIGPAIVPHPVSVGPAIVPHPVSPAVVPEDVTIQPHPVAVGPAIIPSPVVVGPIAPGAPAPLVQIIVNIKSAEVNPGLAIERPVPIPTLEPAPVTPVQVVESAPTPVQVVETAPTPVQVVETAPVPVEPVIIGTPIIPSPAVTLPESLN